MKFQPFYAFQHSLNYEKVFTGYPNMTLYLTLLMIVLAAIGLSAMIPFQLIPRIVRRAASWGILDFPDSRKPHSQPTPRLGGLSIMPAVWLGCSLALLLGSVFNISALSSNLPAFSKAVIGLLIGSSGIFLLGMVDDFKRLSAVHKLATQAGIAALTLHFLPSPNSIAGIELDPWVAQMFIFGWLVVVPNSVNLLDGVDGLTSSIAAVFFGTVSILSLLMGELGWLLILLPTLAAILSFLKFNWKPARIFLGDSGSLLLGFCVAYLGILFALTPHSGSNWNLFISLSLSFVWILDTLLAVFRRYWDRRPSFEIFFRRSRSIYFGLQRNAFANIVRPDRKHIHHRLMDKGYSSPMIVLTLSVLALGFALIGLSLWSRNYLNHVSWSASVSALEFVLGGIGLISFSFFLLRPLHRPQRRAVKSSNIRKAA